MHKYGTFIFVSFMGCCAVYSMSLRQQLQDPRRKPMAALHYNKGDKDVSPNGRYMIGFFITNLNDLPDTYDLFNLSTLFIIF